MLYYVFENKCEITVVNKRKNHPKDKDEIYKILQENHTTSLSGHSGFSKTLRRIQEFYKWPKMKQDIRKFIKKCKQCNENKINRHPIKCPMQITTTTKKPFQKIFMDIVGPLPLTEDGNKFIFTLQDDLTKYFYAYAIPNHEAQTIKFTNFILSFGIPESIVSDNGSEFLSNLLKEINILFKIKHITTSPYHPQSNSIERNHATIKDYLKHFINNQKITGTNS